MNTGVADETEDGEDNSDRLDFGQDFHVWNASTELAEEEASVVHF